MIVAPPIPAEELRVAVVSDAISERNGVGTYYADLVTHLTGRIARAELFCPQNCNDSWRSRLLPPLPGDSTQRIWIPRPIKLWRDVSSLAPHAIVVPTPGPFGLIGLRIAMSLGVPLIVGFHTHLEALAKMYWEDTFGKVCHWYLEWCNRLLFRHSAVVLVNSRDMQRLASRLGARSPELMGTSLAAEFLERPLVERRKAVTRIMFAGRLAGEKNVDEVIAVAHAKPELHLTIAGDGPLRSDVESAAAQIPNLTYLGWVSRSRLISVLDDSDLLLLPSTVESFGTVALEGMARGRPVLVSGACGIADWPELQEGLFTIADDENLIQAVERVRSLPEGILESKAASARRAAEELNEWNLRSWICRLQAGKAIDDPSG